MTEGRPLPLLISFALPLMIGNVFQQLYTVVDTAVVGKALGVGALAALGAADWLNWMMLGVIQGITQGYAIRISQTFGAGDMAQMRRTVGVSAVVSLAAAAVLLTVGQLAILPVLRLLQTPAEILDNGALYLRVMFGGVPIVMAYNLFASILRAMGDGKTPLQAMIVASLLNVALDLLFVLVFQWGISGAAAATLIAQTAASIFCYLRLRRIPELKLSKQDFRPQTRIVVQLLRLGLPVAFQNAIISVGGMIVQTVVNGFGVIFIAGFTATNKLYGVLEIAATSYGYAMATYAGQNLGAGKLSRIREGQRAATAVAMVTSAVIALVMMVFGRWIVGCFISGTPQEIRAATDIAYRYLVIMSVCLPSLYLLYVIRSCIQGVGNTVLPMLSGIAEFVMRTAAAWMLPLWMGADGLFYAEVLAWIGADLILIPSYFIVMDRCRKKMGGA